MYYPGNTGDATYPPLNSVAWAASEYLVFVGGTFELGVDGALELLASAFRRVE